MAKINDPTFFKTYVNSPSIKDIPTTLFEDNPACIAHIKGDYSKGDITKHISKFFYTHELQKNGKIDV